MKISRRTLLAILPLSALTFPMGLLKQIHTNESLPDNSSNDDAFRKGLVARTHLKTVVWIRAVQLFLDDYCSEAHVEGVCTLDGFSGDTATCTLYFLLDSNEGIEHFMRFRETFRAGDYCWVDATNYLIEQERDCHATFATFTAEPVAPDLSVKLAAMFTAAGSVNNKLSRTLIGAHATDDTSAFKTLGLS